MTNTIFLATEIDPDTNEELAASFILQIPIGVIAGEYTQIEAGSGFNICIQSHNPKKATRYFYCEAVSHSKNI